MSLHHSAASLAIWVSILTSLSAAALVILAGRRPARRPKSRTFDFAASARRIRMRPIKAGDDA